MRHWPSIGVDGFWNMDCREYDTVSLTIEEERNRWWVEVRRWYLANWGLEIRVFHEVQTHVYCTRDFTGSLRRISEMSSFGKNGKGGLQVGESCLVFVAVVFGIVHHSAQSPFIEILLFGAHMVAYLTTECRYFLIF